MARTTLSSTPWDHFLAQPCTYTINNLPIYHGFRAEEEEGPGRRDDAAGPPSAGELAGGLVRGELLFLSNMGAQRLSEV